VALQIDLIDALHRVVARIATPSLTITATDAADRLGRGQPLVDFDQVPIDWNEARLLFRQVTDILRRHDAVDAVLSARLHDLGRSTALTEHARRWFAGRGDTDVEMLDEVLGWAMRPFLTRTAEVLLQRTSTGSHDALSFGDWHRGACPVCGGEPDLACITSGAERLLICGRCQTRWVADPIACPFCGEQDRARITSLATPDGTYRVSACQSCRRYLKAFDARRATRAVIPLVDAIATLPLDAAVMQRGFSNG
jgi:formate dehydrogenase maturation protein FdhE